MMPRSVAVAALAAAAVLCPDTVSAELVTLTSGRTLSVQSVVVTEGQAVLHLRSGGQMTCAASLIARVAPDEVPYPPPPEVEVVRATQEASAGPPPAAARPANVLLADPARDKYDTVVTQAARRYNVDPALVHAVITVESRYQPHARSAKGAMGMMQLMPGTARDLQVRNPYDAAANIDGGVRYLRQLLDRFELRLALAAYNAGAATVERFGGIPPYPETRNYVTRVLQLAGAS